MNDIALDFYRALPGSPQGAFRRCDRRHSGNRARLKIFGLILEYVGQYPHTVQFGDPIQDSYDALTNNITINFLGVQTLILTNAAGGLNPAYQVGDLMVIKFFGPDINLDVPMIRPYQP